MSESEPEIECTAIGFSPEDERNKLMVPPCDCPRCRPEAPPDDERGMWLRVSGRRQRLRVEDLELSRRGRHLLG
ncbi:MAG: hypothetical protein GY713_11465 [Actinomycetia bacterium]|nr:hypothetical protein [Actinomycetes bacterium]